MHTNHHGIQLAIQAGRSSIIRRGMKYRQFIDGYSNRYPSDPDSLIFDRLSHAYKLLSNRRKSFRYSAFETMSFYSHSKSSLLEDIFCYPRINQDLINLICDNYWKSSSLRSLVFHDIYNLWHKCRYDVVCDILKHLKAKEIDRSLNSFEELKGYDQIMHIVILAATTGEPLIASSLLVKLENQGIKASLETINTVLSCLLCYRGPLFQHHFYASLKLIDISFPMKISNETFSKLMSFSLESHFSPFFANLLYKKMKKHVEKEVHISRSLKRPLEQLIIRNIEYSNMDLAYKIWEDYFSSPHLFENDPEIVKQLLNRMPKRYGLRIVKQIIPSLEDDSFLEAVLAFKSRVGAFGPETQKLVGKVSTPISRSMLSTLFNLLIRMEQEEESEKILQTIFNTKNGINMDDMDTIICKSLRAGNVNQAIQMVSKVDSAIIQPSLISIIVFLLSFNYPDKRVGFLQELAPLIIKSSAKDNNGLVLASLLKLFIKTEGLNYSKGFMAALEYDNSNGKYSRSRFLLISNEIPVEILELLRCEDEGRINGFMVLLEEAMKEKDCETLQWCIENLRCLGLDVQSVLSRCKEANPDVFHEIFKEQVQKFID